MSSLQTSKIQFAMLSHKGMSRQNNDDKVEVTVISESGGGTRRSVQKYISITAGQVSRIKNMMRQSNITESHMESGAATVVRTEPPDDPKTNDHYFDGQTHYWFYLGNWHEERKDG